MDNYIVSARKYRPSTFKDVVGQKALTTTLRNAILSNKLAHAYLFCGPRGVGKTSCARIFSKTINCFHLTPEGEPCNVCESCIAFNEQRSLNIRELDAASNNSVDDIRSLIEQVRIRPQIGKYNVYIIDEVHMLTSAAFNAFLKTLEEPPHHAIFILATTEKQKILPTILSRCQIYDFSRISVSDVVEHLQHLAGLEQVNAEPEALNIIAQKADGGMRDALSIFDQIISFTAGNITYQAVIDNLNILDYEYYFRLTEAFLTGNVRSSLLILNDILNKGFDGHNFITGLASYFRDLLVCKNEETLVLLEVGESIRERYRTFSAQCSEELLIKGIEIANNCDLNYRNSRNKRLLIELTLIQLTQLSQSPNAGGDKKKTTIEPLATEQSNRKEEVKTATQPTATQTVPTAPTRPQTTISNHQAVETKTPEASPATNLITGMGGMTSFKDIIKSTEQTESTDTTTVQQTDTPQETQTFSIESLHSFWKEFAASLEKQAHLENTMLNHLPSLTEGYKLDVLVYNQEQQKALLSIGTEVLTFLREKLHNGLITMDVRIDEENILKQAFTAEEKLQHFQQINPAIQKLRETFDLRLD